MLAARTLFIHVWQRIVLRATPLSAELLPADWPGATVRGPVMRICAQVAAPSEAWLDKSGLPPIIGGAGFSARFGIVPRVGSEAIQAVLCTWLMVGNGGNADETAVRIGRTIRLAFL